ncbi:MAG: hypothetical protein PVI88_00140 [Nitrosopumilaceae archaeon]|jgi:hypothetical protein
MFTVLFMIFLLGIGLLWSIRKCLLLEKEVVQIHKAIRESMEIMAHGPVDVSSLNANTEYLKEKLKKDKNDRHK